MIKTLTTKIFIFILVLLTVNTAFAQPGMGERMGGSVRGKIIDNATQHAVEYANISLITVGDEQIVNGAMSDKDGYFKIERIRPGSYLLKIKFIGYKEYRYKQFSINRNKRDINIGTVALERAAIEMSDVEVFAERPIVDYKIDKKVIDVSKYSSSMSGSAVEILENIPSVNVDIEGNVSLRGSSSFTVLIDGRPSLLDANDALEQIPASTIRNIEIITNPSAKYDPEGMAGIINVITMKKTNSGSSGLVNVNTGTNNTLGADFLFSKKNEKITWFVKGNYKGYNGDGTLLSERITTSDGIQYSVVSDGKTIRDRAFYGLQSGIDYQPDKLNYFSLSAELGSYNMDRGAILDYEESVDTSNLVLKYLSDSNTNRGGERYSLNANYDHKFNENGHKISTKLTYRKRSGDESSINSQLNENGIQESGSKSTEVGPSKRLHLNVDYEYPMSDGSKLESGFQFYNNYSLDKTKEYEYNPLTDVYELQSEYNNETSYNRNISAVYLMYSREFGGLGVQGGLRTEFTDREITQEITGESATINRWDYFPSAHFSYTLKSGNQLMTSYSRRINRPRGYYLEPFETKVDAYTVRKGNADLLPEYINSMELAYKMLMGRNVIYIEGFYRSQENVIERSQSLYDTNIILQTVNNVGTSVSKGIETTLNLSPVKMWNINLTGSVYDYVLDAVVDSEAFTRTSNNWSIRANNTFRFGKNTQLQLIGRYFSPSVSSQGSSEGFYTSDISLKQTIIKNKLTAILQIRDVFDTGKHDFTYDTDGFYTHTVMTREAPMISLSLKYNFNDYKEKRQERNGSDVSFEEF